MRVLGFGTAIIRSILKTLFPTKGKSPGNETSTSEQDIKGQLSAFQLE